MEGRLNHPDPHYYDAAVWLGLRNQRATNDLLRQQVTAARHIFLADDPHTRRTINIRGDLGGTPGEWIKADLDARWYNWDAQRGAYIHAPAGPPPPKRPTVAGSLAWTFWWAWAPAWLAGFFGALTLQPDAPDKPLNPVTVLFLSTVAFCGIWALVHTIRILAANNRAITR
jgi:hypothetical protein